MTPTLAWQSPDFLKIFDQYDRADFAQEFLRRCPAYRADHAALSSEGADAARTAAAQRARHWGLLFRL